MNAETSADGGRPEAARRHQLLHLGPRDLPHLRIRGVRAGEGGDEPLDGQQLQDLKVLSRLGHHGFVRRHAQQGHVYPERPHEHVRQEPLVPRPSTMDTRPTPGSSM